MGLRLSELSSGSPTGSSHALLASGDPLPATAATGCTVPLTSQPDTKPTSPHEDASFAQLLPGLPFTSIADAGQLIAVSWAFCDVAQPAIACLVEQNGGVAFS